MPFSRPYTGRTFESVLENTPKQVVHQVLYLYGRQALLSVTLLDADMHIVFAVVVVSLSIRKSICAARTF